MSTSVDLPPEILARAFELGIYDVGIGFLPPVSRVCKYWNDIITSTPRLWGIISISSTSSIEAVNSQLVKAKASPLSLQLSFPANARKWKGIQTRLISLAPNWVEASLTTELLSWTSWSDLNNLEVLTLSPGPPGEGDAENFFGDEHVFRKEKFHTFTASGLPKQWILRFLTPSLRHFRFRHRIHHKQYPSPRHEIMDTFEYLTRVTGAYSIELEMLPHTEPRSDNPTVSRFDSLRTLTLREVRYQAVVLCAIAAPYLQTLTVDRNTCRGNGWMHYAVNKDLLAMAPFFSQWSQPNHLPTHLHTLELVECMGASDVPFLIRWLARLPNLVRLILIDDSIKVAATSLDSGLGETNLYTALASPSFTKTESTGWLCPSLMILHLETNHDVQDLIPIAHARGGISPLPAGVPLPARLRRIEASLCAYGTQEEIQHLTSLVDEVNCTCIHCGLTVSWEDDTDG